jgi:hypothetical protein
MQHLLNEGITQALIISILGIVIIVSNLIVIATFINFRGMIDLITKGSYITFFFYIFAQDPKMLLTSIFCRWHLRT